MPAMQRKLASLGAVIGYTDIPDLIDQLPDPRWQNSILTVRQEATFEAVFPKLITFIRQCLHCSVAGLLLAGSCLQLQPLW